jgi:flagellar basal-body rod protein FlgC
MSIFSTLEISGSALAAERQRAEIVAANMANAETTHTPTGGPYRRKEVVFATSSVSHDAGWVSPHPERRAASSSGAAGCR